MKKLILSLVAIATIALSSFGQAPEGFKYQAVVRDAGNTILTNQAVGMQLTIQQGSIGGTAVYTETFAPTTNGYGLVNLEIGSGTTTDDFATIDWANGPFFMETAIDVNGGTSYVVMGTSQLMSVPYALYAKTSGSSIPGPQGPQGPAGNDGVDGLDGATGPMGPQGATGPQGLTGPQGPQGPAGNDGAVGATGPQGPQGPAGNDGAVGATGPQGPQGPAGTNGTNGIDGNDGQSAYEVWIGLGNTGTETDFINSLTGPQGAMGPQGLTGPQGPAGNDGATGPQGPQGPAGNDGQGGVTTAGTNVTITGTGTAGDPYVVNATGGSPTYTIGLWPELGGYVFWVSVDGKHGLVAEIQDQGFSDWYGAQNLISDPTNHSVYGQKFRDWRMPTKFELDEMYLQQGAIGGFSPILYWSSTEYNYDTAWLQNFNNGVEDLFNMDFNFNVRSVRAF
jgi:hypothetical protein